MYNFVEKTKAWQPCNFDGILYQLRRWIFSHGFHQKIRFQRNFKKRPKSDFRQQGRRKECFIGRIYISLWTFFMIFVQWPERGEVVAQPPREGFALGNLGVSGGMLPRKFLDIWTLQNAIVGFLANFSNKIRC